MNNRQLRFKILKHLTHKGEKSKGEKILLSCLKELHRTSNKQPLDSLVFAIINAMPLFRMRKFTRKLKKKSVRTRLVPEFIRLNRVRVSLAIKYLLRAAKKNESHKFFYKKLEVEIIESAQKKGSAVEFKNEVQRSVFKKKPYFRAFFPFF